MDDDAIRSLVTRLARPRPGGGATIERAAILAEGADFDAVMTWIVAHGGDAEAATNFLVPARAARSTAASERQRSISGAGALHPARRCA